MFYRARHKAHNYGEIKHPMLFCLGCAVTTLAWVAVFMLITFT